MTAKKKIKHNRTTAQQHKRKKEQKIIMYKIKKIPLVPQVRTVDMPGNVRPNTWINWTDKLVYDFRTVTYNMPL